MNDRSYHLLSLSARTPQALQRAALNLADHLVREPEQPLGDLAYTLHVGRRHFEHRLALAGATHAELAQLARRAAADEAGGSAAKSNPQVAFVFTGQGAQYAAMGKVLYQRSPEFHRWIDRCDAITRPMMSDSLLACLFDPTKAADLDGTQIAQPALFAVGYALAQLWMSWGVKPAIVMGHSLGEYVAACVAGALSLEDALRLVVQRGRLMAERCEPGAMVSVLATEAEVQECLRPYGQHAAIAAVNGPRQVVVSGEQQAITQLCGQWEQAGIRYRRLSVSHAFHSALMDPMLDEFERCAATVSPAPLQCPLISNLTGMIMPEGAHLDAQYWRAHLRSPVRFQEGLAELLQTTTPIILEIGPRPLLTAIIRQNGAQDQVLAWSLREGNDDWREMLTNLGQLWVHGVPVDWRRFDAGYNRRRVHAPTYPFEQKRYWLDADRSMMLPTAPATASGAVPAAEASGGDTPRQTTRLVEHLVTLCQEVLGTADIKSEDNFFALGGDSLNALQLNARIGRDFGIELPVQALFQAQTLADLARLIAVQQGDVGPGAQAVITPTPRDGELPLSFSQERLWFLDQLQPGSPVYNLPMAVRLTGRFDVAALERTVLEIVRRHEMLRTTFRAPAGQPVQVVEPVPGDWQLPCADLSDLPLAEREQEMRTRASALGREPFDLTRGPLWRAALWKLGEAEYVLLFVLHHIITDGWSFGVLFDEVATHYRAFVNGQSSSQPELPLQYGDFARFQRQQHQGDAAERRLAYWRRRLTGMMTTLELPRDMPRPAVRSDRGATESFALSPALTDALRQLSRQEGTTIFMTLLAAFQALLYRYTGQEDISVGTPVANRSHVETERLIGFFVNTLVLRTDLSGEPSFRSLLHRVREATLEDFNHQALPFEKLVEALQPERNMGHTPLFQIMFVLQNTPAGRLSLPGLNMQQEEVHTGTATFDLTLSMREGEQLVGTFEYNTDLFSPDRIRCMVGHLETLLWGAVNEPAQPISGLPLLTEPERLQWLERSDTAVLYPEAGTVADLFEVQVERTPELAALLLESEAMSYRELNHRSNQVAHHLRRLGLGPDQRVAISLADPIHMVVGMLGILKAGSGYVPLDPGLPRERLNFMLTNADVTLVLTDQSAMDWADSGTRVVQLSEAAAEAGTNPTRPAAPEHLAYMIYTSGSTGTPKGVMVPHGALVNHARSFMDIFGIGPGDRLLQAHSWSFDASAEELYPTLLSGATLVMTRALPELLGAGLLGFCRACGVTHLHLPTAFWHQWVDILATQSDPALPSLKMLAVGGESPLVDKWHVWRRLMGQQVRLVAVYGPTEATIAATYYEAGDESGRLTPRLPIGKPIPNVTRYLFDKHLQPVPDGIPGELYIGGAGLALGYCGQPELTSERFVPHPFDPEQRLYRTGDLARLLPDGNLQFLGRMDRQVKVRGFRIELGEIEAALRQHAAVRDAFAMVREDQPGDRRLTAYVVAADMDATARTELRHFLQERLPGYMLPSALVTLAALPLTGNGKVDERSLPAPDFQGEQEVMYMAPRTQLEADLASVVAHTLGVERVGIHDNFFDRGGHSLLATQVISRVRDLYGVELPLRTMFDGPTVANLAVAVLQCQAERQEQDQLAILLAELESLEEEDARVLVNRRSGNHSEADK